MFHFVPRTWVERRIERKEPMPPAEWNRLVAAFDVPAVVDQLVEVKAGYLLISVGQASGYYLAPNPVYDRYCGYAPGDRCATRDLPLDLYRALSPNGIRLMFYIHIQPGILGDRDAARRLGWDYDTSKAAPDAFVDRWTQVVQWWSDHYGDRLAGWWFDGSGPYTPTQRERIAKAARHGNPDSIINLSPYNDYIHGHCAWAQARIKDPEWLGRVDWEVQKERIPSGRFTAEGLQWHAFIHFGEHWQDRDGFYDTDTEVAYTVQVVKQGGVVTWDCGPNIGNGEGPIGTISNVQMEKLRRIRDAVRGSS